MTNKRNVNNNNALNEPGLIGWPYDPTLQNTYEATDVVAQVANRPIRMLRMIIIRNGPNSNDYQVRIAAYSQATGWQQVSTDNQGGNGPWVEQTDGPIIIPANPHGPNLGLPLDVLIDGSDTPNDVCGKLLFTYGTQGVDGVHFYGFHSGLAGRSTQINRRKTQNIGHPGAEPLEVGPYCDDVARTDANGHDEQEWTCYFPAS